VDLFEGTYTLRIILSFFELFIKIAPYLLVSILIHVFLIRITKKKGIILKVKNSGIAIVAAASLGILSPLPTYAAVPIGLSFIPFGVPFAAVIAFVIASPLINPSVFFLTYTQLGMDIALWRISTAFILAVSGGFISLLLFKGFSSPGPVMNKTDRAERNFLQELNAGLIFFGKHFAAALLISAVVKALISPEFIRAILGQQITGSLLVGIALGVPFYSCGGAAIPFVEVLSDMGMNKGAVLAFLIAGPATKLGTLYIFKSLLGIKIFIFYLIITISGAFLAGMLLLSV
jgi:uncharacterized membrane protein YraQ (UPF0718 family)